ncbi:MAG: BrnA antitoxin family protein [Sphingomonas sp.]|nr:BrnA antitoxin family protein [Sphingomonas sp.]
MAYSVRGRPTVGDEPKQQVTLRLPRDVIGHFKAGGPGWQTRIGEVLQRHAKRDKRKSA